jgi:hypothetical protein
VFNYTKGIEVSVPGYGPVTAQPYSFELTDFEKDVKFVFQFFQTVVLPPEEAQKFINVFKTVHKKLEKLVETYKNEEKPERAQTVEAIRTTINFIMEAIKQNSEFKFGSISTFVHSHLHEKIVQSDKNELQKRRELKNHLRPIYKDLSQSAANKAIEILPSTKIDISYFNELITLLNVNKTFEEKFQISLLADCFLLTDKDLPKLEILVKKLEENKVNPKLDYTDRVNTNIKAWKESGLFLLTLASYNSFMNNKGIKEIISTKNETTFIAPPPIAVVLEKKDQPSVDKPAEKMPKIQKLMVIEDPQASRQFSLTGKMIKGMDKTILSFESSNPKMSAFENFSLIRDNQGVKLLYKYTDEVKAKGALNYVISVNNVSEGEIVKEREGTGYYLVIKKLGDIQNLYTTTLIQHLSNFHEEAWNIVSQH